MGSTGAPGTSSKRPLLLNSFRLSLPGASATQVIAPVGVGGFCCESLTSLPSLQSKCPENCLLHEGFWLGPQNSLGDAEMLYDLRWQGNCGEGSIH